jgi:hypothetical protein
MFILGLRISYETIFHLIRVKYESTIVGRLLLCARRNRTYVDYRLIHYPVVEENRRTRRKTTGNGFEMDTSA